MSRFANYNISLYNMINCVEMLPVDIFHKQKLSNTQSENILNQSLSLFSEKIPWNHQSITRLCAAMAFIIRIPSIRS